MALGETKFPICKSPSDFKAQVGTRLIGVSPEAVEGIERLQPYRVGPSYAAHPLWRLNELANIDKHRTLMLTSVFLQDWAIYLSKPESILAEVIFTSGEDKYRNGAIIAKVPFNAVSDPDTVEMYLAERKFVIAFSDGPISSSVDSVGVTIADLIEFVKTDVVPRFAHFFA